MLWIILVIASVGILFKPRLFTWLGLFFIEIAIFSNGNTSGALVAAIILGAVACLRMEFTKDCSAILYEVEGCPCESPPVGGIIIHATIVALVYAALFYIVWTWGFNAAPGTRFPRLLIIYPAIAFGVPYLSGFLAGATVHDRIVAIYKKECEEKRKRLALACENMTDLWKKALDTYGGCERGRIGYMRVTVKYLPASPINDLYKRVGVEVANIPDYLVPGQGAPEPVQTWVTNENRIQAIEKILQNVGMLQYGRGSICRPIEEIPLSIKIADPENNCNRRPWMPFIENELFVFYKRLDKEYCSALSEIVKYYDGEYKAIKAGLDGEEYVRSTLDMHGGEFFALYGLRLEFPGDDGDKASVETDVLVLAPNGIFAIEVKNYGSTGKYKIVVTADGQWYKVLSRGKRESIPNPVAQNDRHIAYLGRFINDLLGRGMMNRAAIENIVAIANDNVETEVYPGAPLTVTRAGNIYGCIMTDRSQKFTLDELQLIKTELEKRALPPKAYPLYDYSERIKWVRQERKVLHHGAAILNKAKREHPDWFANI